MDGDGAAADIDCDDSNSDIYPGAEELCDGLDGDCDEAIDEGVTVVAYPDVDGDGYGDGENPTEICPGDEGYVEEGGDCDDGDPDASTIGESPTCAAESCLAILEAGDEGGGTQWVLVNGEATALECDAEGGGWTAIFQDDFETVPDARWSLQSTYTCDGWGTTMLGGYNIIAGGEISITLEDIGVPHTEARVEVTYVKLDSWDGELGYVEMNGERLWQRAMTHTEGVDVCGWIRSDYPNGANDDRHYIDEVITTSGESLQLIVGSQLNQDAGDESFGIDDVVIWVR